MSCLEANFFKSKLGSISCSEEDLRTCLRLLNCRPLDVLFVYLGIEVGANLRRSVTWDKVILRYKKKLTPWRRKRVSLGG